MHRRPEFAEHKPDPNLVKPTAGPSVSINQTDNQNQNPNTNHRQASTSNDRPAKSEPVIQRPQGHGTAANNRLFQPNTTPKPVNAPQQNNSNTGTTATDVCKPPPPEKPPRNAPPAAPKQRQQQPAAKQDITEPATNSMDVDYMAGDDDIAFFGSEDERWMMGEFDIDLDVDLGRPIDFEVEESVTNPDDSGFQDVNTSSGNADPRKGTPSVSGTSRNEDVGHTELGSSTNRNSYSGGSNIDSSTSTGIVNQSGGGGNEKEVGFQPVPTVRFSGGSGTDRGQSSNGSTGSGNKNNGGGGRTAPSNTTSSVQPSGSGNGRPSAGGFSFPPGVVRVISSSVLGCEVVVTIVC